MGSIEVKVSRITSADLDRFLAGLSGYAGSGDSWPFQSSLGVEELTQAFLKFLAFISEKLKREGGEKAAKAFLVKEVRHVYGAKNKIKSVLFVLASPHQIYSGSKIEGIDNYIMLEFLPKTFNRFSIRISKNAFADKEHFYSVIRTFISYADQNRTPAQARALESISEKFRFVPSSKRYTIVQTSA